MVKNNQHQFERLIEKTRKRMARQHRKLTELLCERVTAVSRIDGHLRRVRQRMERLDAGSEFLRMYQAVKEQNAIVVKVSALVAALTQTGELGGTSADAKLFKKELARQVALPVFGGAITVVSGGLCLKMYANDAFPRVTDPRKREVPVNELYDLDWEWDWDSNDDDSGDHDTCRLFILPDGGGATPSFYVENDWGLWGAGVLPQHAEHATFTATEVEDKTCIYRATVDIPEGHYCLLKWVGEPAGPEDDSSDSNSK